MLFASIPPEITSGRMYAGPGSGPMWAAAAAWDGLGVELNTAAAGYRAVVSGLTLGPWLGPASASMQAAALHYASWLSATGEQVKQAAAQARAAATAYEAAFAATVPPPLIAQNRALLTTLVATNIFGQNTAAIAATETQYAEMWAQDASTMYAYASGAAAASNLTPFTDPPQDSNPVGTEVQADAVNRATGTSAAGNTRNALSQVVSTVPNVLQTLAGSPGDPTLSDIFNVTASGTYVASGVLFILGPLLAGPIGAALPASALGFGAPALGAAGAAALLSDSSPAPSPGHTEVLAAAGRAASVGGMSVPAAWAGAAPEFTRAAAALPAPALVGFTQAEADGMGPGSAALLPGSLMAAAAGGGGAAGGGWAATRGSGVAERGGGPAQTDGGTRTRYAAPPAIVAHAAPGAHGQANRPEAGQRGDSLPGEMLREEINGLRKQIAELAMEREVLMRSLALWAKGSPE
ncbi:PPE family protein [Mycobacterium sp. SMC-2]|uniref:PPE family protein n=1 Tax=Mycobacterium sp. SMC-2 TaxID=2857058 RepID=UPI0021B2684C|nr:PPE family protein [Mycobacterium sp. SMC-2]UXA04349.1 PPE family protein [Mycobacterium sp. SMC-2]